MSSKQPNNSKNNTKSANTTSNSVEMKVESTPMDGIMFEDEDIMVGHSSNEEDARFDEIIGHIEDIIMDPNFQNLQNQFLDKNYKHFQDTDENRLIYTDLHREYINLIEKFIENELIRRVKNFSMIEFMNNLMSRRAELDGEIFEILLTFEDFLEFKQLMLSHKASKEGRALDLTGGLSIQSVNFETFRVSSDMMQTDDSIHIIPSSSQSHSTIITTSTTTTTTNNNNTANNNNFNISHQQQTASAYQNTNTANKQSSSSSTPLLDNAQIDSDHEQHQQSSMNPFQLNKPSSASKKTNNNNK